MVFLVAGAFVVLVGLLIALYVSQEKRNARHDEQVATLVRQITRTNPSENTLKAMKQTAEVLTDAVDKITGTIGSSFATATGIGSGGIVNPEQQRESEQPDEELFVPDVDMDGFFAPTLLPTNGAGMISPPSTEDA